MAGQFPVTVWEERKGGKLLAGSSIVPINEGRRNVRGKRKSRKQITETGEIAQG